MLDARLQNHQHNTQHRRVLLFFVNVLGLKVEDQQGRGDDIDIQEFILKRPMAA